MFIYCKKIKISLHILHLQQICMYACNIFYSFYLQIYLLKNKSLPINKYMYMCYIYIYIYFLFGDVTKYQLNHETFKI